MTRYSITVYKRKLFTEDYIWDADMWKWEAMYGGLNEEDMMPIILKFAKVGYRLQVRAIETRRR